MSDTENGVQLDASTGTSHAEGPPKNQSATSTSTPADPLSNNYTTDAFTRIFNSTAAVNGHYRPPFYPMSVSLPSCLMPEIFNGSGDFEDYLQQFNTAAMLSGWSSDQHDHRPQYFALRLRENALHFYTTLSSEQQGDYAQLVEAFRQNYTTNVDILKARLKAAKQQPTQDIATFLCDIRTLARRAYRNHPHLIEQIVLTSFIEGLKNLTLRWELRKTKPTTADEALTLAIELDSFLALEQQNKASTEFTSAVNQVASGSQRSDTVDELVRTLRAEIANLKASHSNRSVSRDNNRHSNNSRNQQVNRNNSHDRIQGRGRRDDRSTSGDRSRSVHFEDGNERRHTQRNGHREYDNRNNQRHSPNRNNQGKNSSDYSKNSNSKSNQKQECRHCKRTNHASNECKACFNCDRVGHFRRDCRASSSDQEN